jgi:hypothetical protein
MDPQGLNPNTQNKRFIGPAEAVPLLQGPLRPSFSPPCAPDRIDGWGSRSI